ncbi:hydrogenase expression/formation protein HypC [Labrenzia sp. MBR-25]
MCLAIPARVVSIDKDDMATVALEGIRKPVSIALLEEVAVGDYVLVHVGYALHKLSEEEAERTLQLMAEAGVLAEELEDMAGEPAAGAGA